MKFKEVKSAAQILELRLLIGKWVPILGTWPGIVSGLEKFGIAIGTAICGFARRESEKTALSPLVVRSGDSYFVEDLVATKIAHHQARQYRYQFMHSQT